jgi:PAS domain S-box-containing protein
MEKSHTLNVAIVGGGPGCKSIMDMLFAEKLSQLRMNLVGVACTNPDNVGYRYARERGIYTTKDYHDLYHLEDLRMIIELTGHEEVANEIAKTKPSHVRLMDHVGARIFWDIFQIEEERLEERLRAQHALLDAEKEKEMILDSLMEHVILDDREMRIIWPNRAACESAGLSRSELIGRHCYEIWPKRGTPCRDCPVLEAMETGESKEREKRIPRGSWWFLRGIPVKDAAGRVIGGIEVTLDVTKRKRAEEALKTSEKQYRELVANSLLGVYKSNFKGDILYVNHALARMFEFDSPEEMMSESVLFRYNNLSDRQHLIESLKTKGKVDNLELELLTKTGKKRFALLSAILQGDVMSGMIMDITERKQAEEALREREEQYRDLFENANDLVQSVSPDGHFIQVNRKWHETLGYSPEELPHLTIWDVIHPDFISHCKELFQKVLTGEPASLMEIVFVAKDGKPIWVEGSANCRFEQGKPVFTRGIFRDISERKQAAEETKKLRSQLEQSQRLESIGTLAGGMAHDFNNLLMGIQGNVSLMLVDVDSTHEHYERLRSIEKLVHSGAKLTSHLLGYARKGKYDVKPLDLNQMVRETAETFGRTKKEISIHLELAEDLLPIEADRAQMEQVLLNLFVNAGDAMAGGGELRLETMNVTHQNMKHKLYNPQPGNYVLLMVTDTGMGMDAETKERIFDPFFTTKEIGRGTGLGLASAYGIIKGHSGYIDVESGQGEGATFYVYLPASEKKAEEETKKGESTPEGNETVLLVDDEEVILEVGKDLLEAMGYRVLTTREGKEALELYQRLQDEIEIVVLDMVMPDASGGTVFDEMKKINSEVKVLLSSGYSIDGEASEILARGCNGFIQKPFSMEDFSAAIQKILNEA